MLRFLGQFQADFQLKSGWIEPLLVGGYAPFSPFYGIETIKNEIRLDSKSPFERKIRENLDKYIY